jgi:octaprenyl-diphosphate synthase
MDSLKKGRAVFAVGTKGFCSHIPGSPMTTLSHKTGPRKESIRATASLADILAPWKPWFRRLDSLLDKQCEHLEPGLVPSLRYVIGNQGKRLRPAMVILSAHARDENPGPLCEEEILTIACIVEIIHIATLVHDDILDGARLRRNRLTASAKWGPEVSVLLGDFLFAQASMLAASLPSSHCHRRISEGTRTICTGEILQTQRRFDLKLREEDYLRMIEMKTGALFALACELGAFTAGAVDGAEKSWYEFGRLFGIAYQVYDDCLDLVGLEGDIGKSLGTDLQKGKLTLPQILLLRQAPEAEVPLISSMLLNEHANSQAMLIEAIRRHGTLQQASRRAIGFLQEARHHLQSMKATRGRFALEDLTKYLEIELERLR